MTGFCWIWGDVQVYTYLCMHQSASLVDSINQINMIIMVFRPIIQHTHCLCFKFCYIQDYSGDLCRYFLKFSVPKMHVLSRKILTLENSDQIGALACVCACACACMFITFSELDQIVAKKMIVLGNLDHWKASLSIHRFYYQF